MQDEDAQICPHCGAVVTDSLHSCERAAPATDAGTIFFNPAVPSKREAACYYANRIASGDYRVAIMLAIGCMLLQRRPHWAGLIPLVYAYFPLLRAIRWMRVFDTGDLYGDEYEHAKRQVTRSILLWAGSIVLMVALFAGLLFVGDAAQLAVAPEPAQRRFDGSSSTVAPAR